MSVPETRASALSSDEDFEVFHETRPTGIIRRLFTINRQFLGDLS